MTKEWLSVLDHGFVKLVDMMGSDLRICEAARVSTGSESDKGEKENRKLIRYLYKNEHMSPFEKVVFEFHVKCPIFVARQWFRHRTMSFNEASARYKEFKWECYTPDIWRKQDTKNKQGSIDPIEWIDSQIRDAYERSEDAYHDAIDNDVAREQARIVMPVGQYTEFFMTVNLRNLFHFLELRMHPHAQWEIQQYANAIYDIIVQQYSIQHSVTIFTEMQKVKYALQRIVNKYESLTEVLDNLNKLC